MSTLVNCGVYVEGKRLPGLTEPRAAMAEARERNGFVWCGLLDPDDATLHELAEVFGLPEKAMTHTVRAHHRPKLDIYGDQLCMVVKTARYVAHDSPAAANEIIESGEVIAFLGADFIVTVRHGHDSGLRELRDELESAPERLRLGPAAVLHGIVGVVVDSYLTVTEEFENDIDAMEAIAFEPRQHIDAEHMYLFKREIVELNRAVGPLTAPLRRLIEHPTTLVPEQVRSYFRDVENHLTSVSERVASYDELLTSLVTATLAKLSVQQNSDMRKITSWAAIIAVPTLVVGVYGMNFDTMPELHWRFGYPIVIVVMVAICTGLYRVFRRRSWL
jgi:magnesium transporter